MNIDADGFHEMVTKEDNIVPWVVKFYDGLHPSAKSTPVRRHFKLLASEFEGRVRVAAINCGNERARKEVRVCARLPARVSVRLQLNLSRFCSR